MIIDLSVMPEGKTYENTYSGYMKVFEEIAHIRGDEPVVVKDAPYSWLPLLYHLNCIILSAKQQFEHCWMVKKLDFRSLNRTEVEVLCGIRPETVDALWKCDMQWDIPPGRVRDYGVRKEFIVTNNGSFHRPEVLHYLKVLQQYTPPKRKVVLVPCAADKPYPSPLHQAVLNILPEDYYLCNATGVVGLVPQDLWEAMPHYDSGVPNRWRLMDVMLDYFTRNQHDRIIVYCDFYGEAIHRALTILGQLDRADFILAPIFRYDYMDLMAPKLLTELESALRLRL